MTDEVVRKEHFDEYARRVDERLAHLEKAMSQRFPSLEKRMDLDTAQAAKTLLGSTSALTT
jgi:hypothetical protein